MGWKLYIGRVEDYKSENSKGGYCPEAIGDGLAKLNIGLAWVSMSGGS